MIAFKMLINIKKVIRNKLDRHANINLRSNIKNEFFDLKNL